MGKFVKSPQFHDNKRLTNRAKIRKAPVNGASATKTNLAAIISQPGEKSRGSGNFPYCLVDFSAAVRLSGRRSDDHAISIIDLRFGSDLGKDEPGGPGEDV
jgi:hypothetical protein